MSAIIRFPRRAAAAESIPSAVVELLLDYFAMRAEQLAPGSPDRLKVEALLKRAGRAVPPA